MEASANAALRRLWKCFSTALLSGQLLLRRRAFSSGAPLARFFRRRWFSPGVVSRHHEGAGTGRLFSVSVRVAGFLCVGLDKALRVLGRALPPLGVFLLVATASSYFCVVRPFFHSIRLPPTGLLRPPIQSPPSTRVLPPAAQQLVSAVVLKTLASARWSESELAFEVGPFQRRDSWSVLAVLPAFVASLLVCFVAFLFYKSVSVSPGLPPKAERGSLTQQRLSEFRVLLDRFCGVSMPEAEVTLCKERTSGFQNLQICRHGTEEDAPALYSAQPATEPLSGVSMELCAEEKGSSKDDCKEGPKETEEIGEALPAASADSTAEESFYISERLPLKDGAADSSAIRWKVCELCKRLKAPRTRHCSACGVCIVRQDHHCPWLNQCVGVRNARYFLALLFFLLFLCGFGVWAFASPTAILVNLNSVAALVKARETRVAAVFAATASEVQKLERGESRPGALSPQEERTLKAAFSEQILTSTQNATSTSWFFKTVTKALWVVVLGRTPPLPKTPSAERIQNLAKLSLQAANSALKASTELSAEAVEAFRGRGEEGLKAYSLDTEEEAMRLLRSACAIQAAFQFAEASAQRLAGPPPLDDRSLAFAEMLLTQRGFLIPLAVIGTAVVSWNLGLGVLLLFALHAFLTLSNHTTLSLVVSRERLCSRTHS